MVGKGLMLQEVMYTGEVTSNILTVLTSAGMLRYTEILRAALYSSHTRNWKTRGILT